MLGHHYQTIQHFVTMNISLQVFAVLAKAKLLDSLIHAKGALETTQNKEKREKLLIKSAQNDEREKRSHFQLRTLSE